MIKNILIAILLIIIVGGGAYYAVSHSRQTNAPAVLDSMQVEKPNLVIAGKNLAKVEVWGVPTGTNITSAQYQLLGNASLAQTQGGEQQWLFPIPPQPMLLAQIFAKGYGLNDTPAGQVALPQVGATKINDALWGNASTTVSSDATSTDLTLGVGEMGHFGALAVVFNRMVQDSRCPVDVECIQAGAVTANVTFTSPQHTETKNMPSDEVPQTFDEYKISIAKVEPPRHQNQEIAASDYRITFHIESTAQH